MPEAPIAISNTLRDGTGKGWDVSIYGTPSSDRLPGGDRRVPRPLILLPGAGPCSRRGRWWLGYSAGGAPSSRSRQRAIIRCRSGPVQHPWMKARS